MDKKTVFIKTSRGESEVSGMSGDMKRVLLLIDGNSNFDHVIKRAPPSLRGDLPEIIQRLLDAELIADKSKSKVKLKIVSPRMPPPRLADPEGELDFTSMFKAPSAEDLAAEAVRQKEREASRLKAVEAEQLQAATIARQQAEIAAKAKAEAEAKVKQEAAERQAAEAREKAEAAARLSAEQEAERVKAQRDAEEQARRGAEARRLEAEQEAARVKAELEAAAKAQREAEVRVRQEAEAAEKAKAEAEKVRRKAEEEAARIQAALEAAKARVEAEAKALAEERARIEAEERQRREAEAARIKAEEEAAARAMAEEERRQREAEAARIKAGEEAAARARAEEERRQREAEAARIKAEEEAAARARAGEAHKIDNEVAQPQSGFAFKIDLDGLQDVMPAPVMVEQDNKPESAFETPQTISNEPGQQEIAQPAESEEQKIAQPDIGVEMARLKAEQDAQQLRAVQAAKEQEEAQRLAAEQAAAWADAELRATQQSKLEAEQAAIQAALAQAKAQQKAAWRGRHKSVSPVKLLGGLFGLILILVFMLPLFWPMEKYIAPIGQRISARLGQPVTVGGLKASLLPLPKMEISRLVVGANQELQVENVTLRFDPFSFFSADRVIDEVSLRGVAVEGKSLERVVTGLQGLNGESGFVLRRVNVQSLQIRTEGFSLPPLSGNAQFDNGAFVRLALHDKNNKMHLDLKSAPGGRLQIAFGIRENTLPLLPKVMFGDFSANGEIAAGEAVFSELDAHAYGGIWSGRGRLSWGKEWRAEARINAKTMEMDKMFAQYGISGELFTDGTVSAKNESLAGLANSLRVEANFEAKRGVINGIDVVETARLLSRDHLAGGRTHFDQMNGSFLLENHVVRLRQIKISSGMLNASGSFDIANDGRLSGSFNSEIKMRAGNNLLLLSGSLAEPKLQAR